jgi:hypothetical protein
VLQGWKKVQKRQGAHLLKRKHASATRISVIIIHDHPVNIMTQLTIYTALSLYEESKTQGE